MCKKRLLLIVVVLGMTASLAGAAIVPIDSCYAGDPNAANDPNNPWDPNIPLFPLESVTVGDYTVLTGADLLPGTTTHLAPDPNDPNALIETLCPENDDLDINTALNWRLGQSTYETVDFGGVLWIDTNGDLPDFFLFEAGGNGGDDPEISVILEDGTIGAMVKFPAAWGPTGYLRNEAAANDEVEMDGQELHGMCWDVNDMLDPNGNPLGYDAVVKGFQFTRSGTDPVGFFAIVPPVRPLASLDVNDPNVAEPSADIPILATAINGISVEELILGTTTARLGQQERADNFDVSSKPGYTARTNDDNPPTNLVITLFDVPVSQVFVLEKDGNDACTVTLLDAEGAAVGPDIPFQKNTWMITETSEWPVGGISITPPTPIFGVQIHSTGVDVLSVSAVPAPVE